jgi:hypothetical protein
VRNIRRRAADGNGARRTGGPAARDCFGHTLSGGVAPSLDAVDHVERRHEPTCAHGEATDDHQRTTAIDVASQRLDVQRAEANRATRAAIAGCVGRLAPS